MNASLFSRKIVEWYEQHHRNLPWRKTRDPYKIWLSEIILQQTRVAQGLPYYRAFVRKYPKLSLLASAPEQEILRLWQGLGYYSRARNLHTCAKQVHRDFRGKFPVTFIELRKLKGVGDYTASAIASIAFNERVAVVDGNVYRVLARVFGIHADIASIAGKRKFTELANQLLPPHAPGTYNQAVMEFGALHCTPRNPNCEDCPLQRHCVAFQKDLQLILPVKIRKAKVTQRILYYVVIRSGQRWLMRQRTGKDIWSGLYDFPVIEAKTKLKLESIMRELKASGLKVHNHTVPDVIEVPKHILSHQVIHARFVEVSVPPQWKIPRTLFFVGAKFYSASQVSQLPKSVLISRYLKRHGVG